MKRRQFTRRKQTGSSAGGLATLTVGRLGGGGDSKYDVDIDDDSDANV